MHCSPCETLNFHHRKNSKQSGLLLNIDDETNQSRFSFDSSKFRGFRQDWSIKTEVLDHGSTEGKKENKWKLTRVINQNY